MEKSATLTDYRQIARSPARRLFLGVLLNSLGSGLTMALLLVYLHDIRGFENSFGALLLSGEAAVGIAAAGPVGTLVDKYGPKRMMIVGLALQSAATALWSVTTTHALALGIAFATAIASAMVWPPQMVLLTRMVPAELRQKAFAVQFMLLNLGLGLGGLLAATLIVPNQASSFELLYRLDALTYLVYLLLALGFSHGGPVATDRAAQAGGYREVFADRRFLLYTVGALATLTFGYASLQTGLSVLVTQHLGLSPKWLGLIFGANTFAIVVLQVPVLRLIGDRAKFWVMAGVGVIFATSWLMIGSAALLTGVAAGLMVAASQVVFAFGEMLWSPTAPALVNEMAPEHLRGRYNSLGSLQWSISGVIGPAVAAGFIGRDLWLPWMAVTTVGSLIPVFIFAALARQSQRASIGEDSARR